MSNTCSKELTEMLSYILEICNRNVLEQKNNKELFYCQYIWYKLMKSENCTTINENWMNEYIIRNKEWFKDYENF